MLLLKYVDDRPGRGFPAKIKALFTARRTVMRRIWNWLRGHKKTFYTLVSLAVMGLVVFGLWLAGVIGKTATPSPVPPPVPEAADLAVSTPSVPPPPSPAQLPSVQELIQDLGNSNGAVAKDAACRLLSRPEAIPNLVSLFSEANPNLKARVLWCFRRLGEPCRKFLVEAVNNPAFHRPAFVATARDILDQLSDQFLADEKEQRISAGLAMAEQAAIAKLAALKAELAERRAELIEARRTNYEFAQRVKHSRNPNDTYPLYVMRGNTAQLGRVVSGLDQLIKTMETRL